MDGSMKLAIEAGKPHRHVLLAKPALLESNARGEHVLSSQKIPLSPRQALMPNLRREFLLKNSGLYDLHRILPTA